MLKNEFETLADTEVSQDEYEVIETVYMYYPGIEDKNQMVFMYKIGMHLIVDCHTRAKELKVIEQDMAKLQKRAALLTV